METTSVQIMELVTGVLISLGLFSAVFFSIYFSVRAKSKERMAIIEKGGDLSDLYKKRSNTHGFFKMGMVVLGVGIGLLFAGLLAKAAIIPSTLSYFSMILLFGGAGILLANYMIANGKVGKS